MREICILYLFVLATILSAANIKNDNEILEGLRNSNLTDFQREFVANISAHLNNEGRNKQSRKRIKDMLKKPQIPPVTGDPVQAVQSRIPCDCKKGVCSCCFGGLFFSNKGCMKIRYMPEDFAFELKMTFNDNVLYKNTMSGKNPRPICISPPRFGQFLEMCAKFHDIYFIGRNMHICLDVSATIGEFDLVDRLVFRFI
jgi:Domain of unknown function (DUF4773)